MQIARLSLSSVNKKIAMCADPGWGDLLVHRYRKSFEYGNLRKKLKPAKCASARHAKYLPKNHAK